MMITDFHETYNTVCIKFRFSICMRVMKKHCSKQNYFMHILGLLNLLLNEYEHVCMYVSLFVIAYINVLEHELIHCYNINNTKKKRFLPILYFLLSKKIYSFVLYSRCVSSFNSMTPIKSFLFPKYYNNW